MRALTAPLVTEAAWPVAHAGRVPAIRLRWVDACAAVARKVAPDRPPASRRPAVAAAASGRTRGGNGMHDPFVVMITRLASRTLSPSTLSAQGPGPALWITSGFRTV